MRLSIWHRLGSSQKRPWAGCARRLLPGDWSVAYGSAIGTDAISDEMAAFFARNGGVVTDDRTSHSNTVFLPKLALIRTLAPMHTLGFTVQKGYRTGGAGIQRSSNTE